MNIWEGIQQFEQLRIFLAILKSIVCFCSSNFITTNLINTMHFLSSCLILRNVNKLHQHFSLFVAAIAFLYPHGTISFLSHDFYHGGICLLLCQFNSPPTTPFIFLSFIFGSETSHTSLQGPDIIRKSQQVSSNSVHFLTNVG